MQQIAQVAQITATLAELDAQRAALELDLAEAKESARDEIVQAVRDLIAEAGFGIDEVLPLLEPAQNAKPARKRRSNGDARVFPTYALATDQSKTYVRGVLPAWMKDAMLSFGLDPAEKSDREQFKSERMVAVY